MNDDALRERRIQHYNDMLLKATTPMQKRHYWRLMRAEINARSAEQVKRMAEAYEMGDA